MTDATARIKNLSIAVEAISRVNCPGSDDFLDRLTTALEEELVEYKKEQAKRRQKPTDTSTDDDFPL